MKGVASDRETTAQVARGRAGRDAKDRPPETVSKPASAGSIAADRAATGVGDAVLPVTPGVSGAAGSVDSTFSTSDEPVTQKVHLFMLRQPLTCFSLLLSLGI